MDIGSAKVDSTTQANIPHHMIDIVDIDQGFNAADYHQLASDIIQVSKSSLYQFDRSCRMLLVEERYLSLSVEPVFI